MLLLICKISELIITRFMLLMYVILELYTVEISYFCPVFNCSCSVDPVVMYIL